VNRPSSSSKARVLAGVSISAQTRVRIVEEWIAGQFSGSRRSRSAYFAQKKFIY